MKDQKAEVTRDMENFLRNSGGRPIRREKDITWWSVGKFVLILQDYGFDGYDIFLPVTNLNNSETINKVRDFIA